MSDKKKLPSEKKHDNLLKSLSFITNQNKIKAQMCSCLLIHRRRHSAVVSRISINCSVMGSGVGVWKVDSNMAVFQCPSEHPAGTGQWHKHETTLSVISDSLGTLGGTQRTFMQHEKLVHVHIGNYIWLCAHCYQRPPFLLCECFKSTFRKETNSLLGPSEGTIFINPSRLFSEQTGAYCRRKWEYSSGLLD